MNIGYHSDFMDRIIERADKRQERMEKMINKMLDKSEPILNAGKPKPMTNEEWFCTLSTEEKAKFFKGISEKCLNCGGTIEYDEIGECPFGRCRTGLNEYEDWLKEIHE